MTTPRPFAEFIAARAKFDELVRRVGVRRALELTGGVPGALPPAFQEAMPVPAAPPILARPQPTLEPPPAQVWEAERPPREPGPGFRDFLRALPPAIGGTAKAAREVFYPTREEARRHLRMLLEMGQGMIEPGVLAAKEWMPWLPKEEREAAYQRRSDIAERFARDPLSPFFFAAPPGAMALGGVGKAAQELRAASQAVRHPVAAVRPIAAEAAMRVGQPRAALRVLGKPQVAGAGAARIPGGAAAWQTGADRPFAFDPNSTVNQGRFRLLPPVSEKGRYFTRQATTPGVSYIVDIKENAVQSVRFNKAQFTETQAAQWWEANRARLGRPVEPSPAAARLAQPEAAPPAVPAGAPPPAEALPIAARGAEPIAAISRLPVTEAPSLLEQLARDSQVSAFQARETAVVAEQAATAAESIAARTTNPEVLAQATRLRQIAQQAQASAERWAKESGEFAARIRPSTAEVAAAGKLPPESQKLADKGLPRPLTPGEEVQLDRIVTEAAGAPPAKPPIPPTAEAVGAVPPELGPIPYRRQPIPENVIGLRSIEVGGVTRLDRLTNLVRRTLGKPFKAIETSEVATPAMRERARVRPVISSVANQFGMRHQATLRKVFTFDNQGGVPNLTGIDPSLPGPPTIADIAARYPRFVDQLTPAQRTAMEKLRADLAQYRSLADAVGMELRSRPDVIDGGFYVPRGGASLEGIDDPLRISAGRGPVGGKRGFEKVAVFDSQAQGIQAGYEYGSLGDTLTTYGRGLGERATDEHVASYFRLVTDEFGNQLGSTPKMRMLQQNPEIAQQMESLRREVARLQGLTRRLSERQRQTLGRFFDDPTFDDIDAVREALQLAVVRGPSKGENIGQVQAALEALRSRVKALQPEYKVALRRATQTPRTEMVIGLPGLQGRTYPSVIANAANKVIQREGQLMGRGSAVVEAVRAFNNLYRGMTATLDNSAVGIQGLLGAASNQKAYVKALKVNMRAWLDEDAVGAYYTWLDAYATERGLPTIAEMARDGVHVGGIQTEFMLGRGVTAPLGELPVVKQANRAFGAFGDSLRPAWYLDEVEGLLRKGRTYPEIRTSGDAERLAKGINGATGWSERTFGGDLGDFVLYAPRFFQSRLETLVRGVMGLRPGASIEQRFARRSLLKLIGYGTLLTVAANEALGNETDFRPILNGRYNSNFMRIRFAGRDWSVFGTWDSLARAIVMTAMGKPQQAVRGMGSGVVARGWDLISGYAFGGRRPRANPIEFGKWLLESFTPFAAEEIPAAAAGIAKGIAERKPSEVMGGVVTIAGEVIGAKSMPMTLMERLHASTHPGHLREAEAEINRYFGLPVNERVDYRKDNPEVDAKLFITGQVDSVRTWKAQQSVVALMQENRVDPKGVRAIQRRLKEIQNWTKLGKKPPHRAVDDIIELLHIEATRQAPEISMEEWMTRALGPPPTPRPTAP